MTITIPVYGVVIVSVLSGMLVGFIAGIVLVAKSLEETDEFRPERW